MALKPGTRPHGELRQSQVIGTYGPGSLLDLPNHSVLVGGLDGWFPQGGERVTEPRLVAKIKPLLGISELELRSPPVELEGYGGHGPPTGLPCFLFPEWFVTQDDMDGTRDRVRTRALVHRDALTKGKFIDRDRKNRTVVPVRFVRACRKGHIGDIDWYALTHGGPTDCRQKQKMLFLEERGATGDLSEVWVRCECNATTDLLSATRPDQKILGHCDGARPWLGLVAREKCSELNRFLVRNASNAYFTHKMAVISLPERDEEIKQTVDAIWDFVSTVSGPEHLAFVKTMPKVAQALAFISEEELLAEVHRRKTAVVATPDRPVKEAELKTLMATKEEMGEDRPHGNYYAKTLPMNIWSGKDKPWMQGIERVVLVHRLREVVAQIGFTRFEPPSSRTDGDLDMGVERASLAREVKWLPAIENRGEGIFLQFSNEAMQEWMNKGAVVERGKALLKGFDLWQKQNPKSNRDFPGVAYYMLHSFAHLLITSVSLECGYPSSSIRERIYRFNDLGYGVLLYTGTTDAEGTLGGLIQVGRRIHQYVRSALEMGQLCSNDPVCAEHEPNNPHEARYLQGAACHGCLLISETCCEQQNDFLDRALVIPTVENAGVEFFSGWDA